MNYSELTTNEEKIDMVLNYVVSLGKDDLLNREQIVSNMDANSHAKEISEILLKLHKDGYVSTNNTMGGGYYVSNFDGRMFIQSGGYRASTLRKAEAVEQQRIDAAQLIYLESQNLSNSGRLNTLTHRLVLAGWFAFAAAVFLFAWQVWIWLYPIHKDYPYWFWEKVPTEKTLPKNR
jgi:hypothetical protein